MATTLKMKDGDLEFDDVTGRTILIDGYDKCSQDVAESLLTIYDSLRDFGSELDTLTEQPANYGGIIGKGLISKFVSDAIKRLMAQQSLDPTIKSSEKIMQISKLIAKVLDYEEAFFYVEVENEAQEAVSGGYKFVPKPVSLEHLNYDKSAVLDNGQPELAELK